MQRTCAATLTESNALDQNFNEIMNELEHVFVLPAHFVSRQRIGQSLESERADAR